MKRILFIDQYGVMGGGQRVLLELTKIASSHGYETKVLAPAGGDLERAITPSIFIKLNVSSMSVGKKGFFDYLKLLLTPISLIKKRAELAWADIVYLNGPRIYFAGWIFSWFFDKRFFYHVHLRHGWVEKFLIYLISKSPRTSAVILNSNFIYEDFCRTFPSARSSNRLIVVENSLPREFEGLQFQNRWSGGLSRVVCIGRLGEEKGHDLLIEAARKLSRIEFVFFGSSDFSSQDLEKRLREIAPPNVKFVGKTDDLISTLKAMNVQVSVVPSKMESFGLVAIESMACSCLTVVSGKGGLKEIASKTGALVADTSDAIVETLNDIASMSTDDQIKITRRQFDLTKVNYQSAGFSERWINCLETGPLNC